MIIPIIRFFMTNHAIDSVTGYHCSDQPFDDLTLFPTTELCLGVWHGGGPAMMLCSGVNVRRSMPPSTSSERPAPQGSS